jgi:hypothetical protein
VCAPAPLNRYGAALAVVAVEQPVIGACPDILEFIREVESILDTPVHAHATQRIVDMPSKGAFDTQEVPISSVLPVFRRIVLVCNIVQQKDVQYQGGVAYGGGVSAAWP